MTKHHDFRVYKRDFVEIRKRNKKCELRPSEDYSVGDTICFHETDNGLYTGRKLEAKITHITEFRAEGTTWALMSFKEGKK